MKARLTNSSLASSTASRQARAAGMGGSQIYAAQGQVFSVRTLLAATMVQSANDAATALAEKIAGSNEAFAERMNRRAGELGDGWHPINLSPAQLADGAPHHLRERLERRGSMPCWEWHHVDHHLSHQASAFLAAPFERPAEQRELDRAVAGGQAEHERRVPPVDHDGEIAVGIDDQARLALRELGERAGARQPPAVHDEDDALGDAACVQIEEGLTSLYRWQGKDCEEPEVRLTIKTLPGCEAALQELFRAEHFAAMEPRLPRFLEQRDKWDPQRRLRSAQSVRLLGDRR